MASRLFNSDKDPNKELMHVNLDVMQPVYFCTVEPSSEAEEKRLIYALECLQREDPSLKVLFDDEENYGQTVIQGMGELHLDIIKDRILKEYKLKVYFGPLNIAFKEEPTEAVTEALSYEKSLNERKNSVQLELSISPKKNYEFTTVIDNREDKSLNDLSIEHLNAITHGIRSALNKGFIYILKLNKYCVFELLKLQGVLLKYPIIDTEVILTKFNTNKGVQLPYISSAAYTCTLNALKRAECVIIQPVMQIEVNYKFNFELFR